VVDGGHGKIFRPYVLRSSSATLLWGLQAIQFYIDEVVSSNSDKLVGQHEILVLHQWDGFTHVHRELGRGSEAAMSAM
jgi:hypothetical protein